MLACEVILAEQERRGHRSIFNINRYVAADISNDAKLPRLWLYYDHVFDILKFHTTRKANIHALVAAPPSPG